MPVSQLVRRILSSLTKAILLQYRPLRLVLIVHLGRACSRLFMLLAILTLLLTFLPLLIEHELDHFILILVQYLLEWICHSLLYITVTSRLQTYLDSKLFKLLLHVVVILVSLPPC